MNKKTVLNTFTRAQSINSPKYVLLAAPVEEQLAPSSLLVFVSLQYLVSQ